MDFMFGGSGWCDNFDFTERYDNSYLRGPRTAPDLVGKGWIRNDGSLCYWGKNTVVWFDINAPVLLCRVNYIT